MVFVWDPRNQRVLVSPWLVEQEVSGELTRLHRLGIVALATLILAAAGGLLVWITRIDLRLQVILVLAWLVAANRLAAWLWDLAIRRAVRRWRSGFRGRVLIVSKDCLTLVPARGDVVIGARVFNS